MHEYATVCYPPIHVILIISKKKTPSQFRGRRSTYPLCRGIGLPSRIQNSIIHVSKRRILQLVLRYSSLACILPSDLARSRCAHICVTAIACPWAVRSCCFSPVALRSSTRRTTPRFIACNIKTRVTKYMFGTVAQLSENFFPECWSRHRRLERNDVLREATSRCRRRKFHVLGANFLLTELINRHGL
jgi:hypothetical protein